MNEVRRLWIGRMVLIFAAVALVFVGALSASAVEKSTIDEEANDPVDITGAFRFEPPPKLKFMSGQKPETALENLSAQVEALNTQMVKVCQQLGVMLERSNAMTKNINGLKKKVEELSKK